VVAPAPACGVGQAALSPVLDALRRHFPAYTRRFAPDPHRLHTLRRLMACRTAALGAHTCVCKDCGWSAPLYNSCRDRHCPQCQGAQTADWLAAQQARMLPVEHFQVVFTLPAALRPIAFANPDVVYRLLFSAGASVLQDLSAQRLDARLGLTGVLHTWTQALDYHPHVHFLVTAGGLHRDGDRWVSTGERYLFPQRIMGAMFRGRFLEGLIAAFEAGELALEGEPVAASKGFRSTVRSLSKRHARWVVHVEPPGGRPVAQVAKYLARYVKRVAISDARVVSVTDEAVTFRTRAGPVTLAGAEFVRRFSLHVLPRGFRKVRHFGLYAPGGLGVAREQARGLLVATSPASGERVEAAPPPRRRRIRCPDCGGGRWRYVFGASSLPALPASLRSMVATARGPP